MLLARKLMGAGALTLDPDAAALIARMSTQPTRGRKKLISDTIVALKAAGLWTKFDVLYLFAAHSQQAANLNWKGNSYEVFGSGTFGADDGYAENCALTLGYYKPSSGPQYQQYNCHIMAWTKVTSVGPLGDIAAVGGGGLAGASLYVGNHSGAYGNLQDGTGYQLPIVTGEMVAAVSRSQSANKYVYTINSAGTMNSRFDALTATAPVANPFLMSGDYGTKRYRAVSFGSGLSDAQVQAFRNIIRTYLLGLGLAV